MQASRSKVRLARCCCTLGPGGALSGQAGAGLGGGGFQHGLSLQAQAPGQTPNYSLADCTIYGLYYFSRRTAHFLYAPFSRLLLWGLCSAGLGRRLSRQRPYHGAASRAFWFMTMAEKVKVPGSGSDPPTPMIMGLTLAIGLL